MIDLSAVFLGGLGASLVASVLAYWGARQLQDAAIRRRERGSARAVYYEVARIASDLTIAFNESLPTPPVSTATYDQAAGDLALFLAPLDFDVVGFAYYSVHLYQWGEAVEVMTLPGLPEIVSRFAAARDVLARAAFTPAEMASRRAASSS